MSDFQTVIFTYTSLLKTFNSTWLVFWNASW